MADVLAIVIAAVGLAVIFYVYRRQRAWARQLRRAIRALPEHRRERSRT